LVLLPLVIVRPVTPVLSDHAARAGLFERAKVRQRRIVAGNCVALLPEIVTATEEPVTVSDPVSVILGHTAIYRAMHLYADGAEPSRQARTVRSADGT